LAKAKEKAKKDDYQKALAAYSLAMKSFRKKEDKACELLKDFIAKYSSEKELIDRVQIYLTLCEGRKQKTKVSLKDFEDYYQYGIYKMNQGNYEEALKLFQKAQNEEPKEGKIHYLMATIYCLTGKQEECIDSLKKAVHLDKFFKILANNESSFIDIKEDKRFKLITKLS